MRKFYRSLALAVVGVIAALGLSATALAHHSTQAEFDMSKTLPFTGKMTRVELVNPHSYLFFTMKDAKGKEIEWAFETLTPGALKRAGFSLRDAFKVGENYTLYYSPARNGKALGIMHAMVLSDGRFMASAPPENLGPARALYEKYRAAQHLPVQYQKQEPVQY